MGKKLGQEPAFACTSNDTKQYDAYLQEGMSKRFYAACAAMQGLCADTNVVLDEKGLVSTVQLAYRCADELLKQENL